MIVKNYIFKVRDTRHFVPPCPYAKTDTSTTAHTEEKHVSNSEMYRS